MSHRARARHFQFSRTTRNMRHAVRSSAAGGAHSSGKSLEQGGPFRGDKQPGREQASTALSPAQIMERKESTSAAVQEATGGESTWLTGVMEGVGPLALTFTGDHSWGPFWFCLIGLLFLQKQRLLSRVLPVDLGPKPLPGLRSVVTAMINWRQSTPSHFATSVYTSCPGRRLHRS